MNFHLYVWDHENVSIFKHAEHTSMVCIVAESEARAAEILKEKDPYIYLDIQKYYMIPIPEDITKEVFPHDLVFKKIADYIADNCVKGGYTEQAVHPRLYTLNQELFLYAG